jgi:phosphoribosylglycinamide formyltransferase-1
MSTALTRPAARLAVLASGRGSHLRNLYKACSQGVLDAKIGLVVSNNVRSSAWHFAASENLPHWFCDTSNNTKSSAVDQALAACLIEHRIDWVITAGYLKKIGPTTLDAFPNRIINIHPALLPNYGGAGMYGQNVHRAVLAAKERQSGATVHYVTARYDEGAIIAQNHVTITQGMTPDSLADTILKIEHPLLVQALQGLLTHHD